MTLTFERVTDADAEALLRAQIAAFEYDDVLYGVGVGGPPGYNSMDDVLTMIRDEDCYKIVYEGQTVGGISVVDYGEGHLHLDRLFIHPDYHNLGIGSQAMRFIEGSYPTATRWTLDTPTYAVRNQHFYEKFGYVNTGERWIEGDDISLIAYEKHMPERTS